MTARTRLSNNQAAPVAVSSPIIESKLPAKRTKTAQSEELIQTSFRLPLSKWKKLQELSIDERRSVQAILIGALEAEFSKRGLLF